MPIEFVETKGNLISIRIQGTVTYDDWLESQSAMAKHMDRLRTIRVLAILDGFSGWEKSERWGELGFFHAHDASIESIAIVGDSSWENDMLAFCFAGMRKAQVQFFEKEADATSWLESQV